MIARYHDLPLVREGAKPFAEGRDLLQTARGAEIAAVAEDVTIGNIISHIHTMPPTALCRHGMPLAAVPSGCLRLLVHCQWRSNLRNLSWASWPLDRTVSVGDEDEPFNHGLVPFRDRRHQSPIELIEG